MREVRLRETVEILRLAGALVIMEHVQADADVRFAALLDKRDRGVQAGAEGVRASELEREADAEARRPLRRLLQRHDGPAERFRIDRLREVRDEHERGNGERLAEFEPAAEVIEMG